MTMIFDLPLDLVEEILSRVPLTCLGAVRCTCKRWNDLSKDRILCKAEARHQFLGFMMKDLMLCSVRFDFHGILNKDGEEFVDPSIKEIGCLLAISEVFHCDGLLLCVTWDKTSHVVWNPYLGQTKWIHPRNAYHRLDRYALGYDNNHMNRNHKILRYLCYSDDLSGKQPMVECEIYDLKSNSWRVLDVVSPDRNIILHQYGAASLKGNTYFFAKKLERRGEGDEDYPQGSLICFDFTTESFGQFLDLPFHLNYNDVKTLSSVKEEKLAALFYCVVTVEVEIWVTTKIEPNSLLWSKFLKIDFKPYDGLGFDFELEVCSFFIDEEKKLAVVFDVDGSDEITKDGFYNTAYIIGENENWRVVDFGPPIRCLGSVKWPRNYVVCCPLVCSSSYVPSFVQINQTTGDKRKRKRINKL